MLVRHAFRGLLLFFALLVGAPVWAVVCHVTTAGDALNVGTSWQSPTTLVQALAFPETCTEIWVAEGVYKPASETDRFQLYDGVEMYGGFAGTETSREQRDWVANLTVLSGDIDNNDVAVDGVVLSGSDLVGVNSQGVVLMAGTGPGTVLDGFTITAGFGSAGAGLLVAGPNAPSQCSPVLSHLVFSGNSATKTAGSRGGGLFLDASGGASCAPTLSDILFRGNHAHQSGAMHSSGNSSSATPSLTRVHFVDNRAVAGSGGAVGNIAFGSGTSSPTMSQVTFFGNRATVNGGAIVNLANGATARANMVIDRSVFAENIAVNGGAIANVTGNTATVSPSITNVTFSANSVTSAGGAIYSVAADAGAIVNPTLNNVTFSGNQVGIGGRGSAMFSEGLGGSSATALRNAILWNNPIGQGQELAFDGNATVTVDHSIVKGSGGSSAWIATFGTDGGGNLDVDPLLGELSEDIGDTYTMPPAIGSPAIDAGLNCPAVDQRGIVRPQGAQCDMGAVEVFTTERIFRDSFEEGVCSGDAVSKAAFLTRVRSAIDGATVCIPPFSGSYAGIFVTACTNNSCAGGAPGCPVTITAAPFADGGDFGAGHLTSTGTASDVTFPVNIEFVGNCEYTASGITTSYALDYIFTPDGGGVFAALLNRFVPAATIQTLTSPNSTCNNFGPNVQGAFANEGSEAVAAAVRPAIEAATLEQTVCPLQ